MGIHSSDIYAKKRKVISVISLNYSGILLSPFEFFSNQNQAMTEIQTNISNIYKKLLKKRYAEFNENKKQNKFKWNLGKIDQKMQKERYSPLYNRDAGIQNNKIIGEGTFNAKWNDFFALNIQAFKKKDPGFKYTQQQKNQTREFDLLCYKTILVQVYPILNHFNFEKLENLNVNAYRAFMNKMFDKSFLNEQKKLQKTFSAMQKQKIDIVFAQQADVSLIKALQKKKQQYVVIKQEHADSIIALKRSRFHNYFSLEGRHPLSHMPQLQKQLNWNNDTVVTFVDNLILISGHLSSKKQKNPEQVYNMIQSLKKLHAIFPMCHIIVGCDVNSFAPQTYAQYCQKNEIYCTCKNGIKFIGQSKIGQFKIKQQKIGQPTFEQKDVARKPIFTMSKSRSSSSIQNVVLTDNKHRLIKDCLCFKPQNCEIFPKGKDSYTTSKQRTYLQPQVSKAEEIARVCRDHLIIFKSSDIHIQKTKVCTILDKSPLDAPCLPCEQHPYDHYVVKGQITVNVMTHFGQDQNQ